MKSKETVSSLKKKLWPLFSEYIRKRDCLRTTGSIEYGECITCDRGSLRFDELDAGHFVPRTYSSTLFDETNVHAQCKVCNGFKEGEQYIHGIEIDKLYGEGTADKLMLKKREIKKFTLQELRDLREDLKQKIEAMKG